MGILEVHDYQVDTLYLMYRVFSPSDWDSSNHCRRSPLEQNHQDSMTLLDLSGYMRSVVHLVMYSNVLVYKDFAQ